MDLSGGRFVAGALAPAGFAPLSMLLASAAGRQAATPTARLAARLAAGSGVGRTHGAFERETATLLRLMGQG